MSRIGVFVCHCGENISATVDCDKVAKVSCYAFPEWLTVWIINICALIPDRT